MTHTHNFLVVNVAFGNDLEALVNDTALPLTMKRLVSRLTMPNLVTIDTADEAKQVGEVIRVNKPIELGAAKVHGEKSTATDLKAEKVDLRLDQHLYQSFRMSDREFTGTMPGTIPSALEAAVDSLATAVNAAIFNEFAAVSNFSGVLDSQNARTKKDLITAKTKLNAMKVSGDRKLVICSETEGDLLQVFTAGNDQAAEVEGAIGRRYGFDIYSDIMCEDHVAGTASADSAIVLSVGAIAGARILVVEGATAGATVNKGDVITVSNQSFAAAEEVVLVNGSGVITVVNPVKYDIADGASVIVAGTHRGDIAFTKDSVVCAFRQLESAIDTSAVTVGQMTDPGTGITLRMLAWYDGDTEATTWKLEVFFGVKAVAPERAIRVGGH